MTFDLSDEVPSRLAAIVMSDTSGERREQAMDQLIPVIREIARKKAKGLGPEQFRQELIDESVGLIWEKLAKQAYDPRVGPFEGWCGKVLKNWMIDRCRSRERDRLKTNSDESDKRPKWEKVLDEKEPLGRADLQRIEGWGRKDRVLLTCIGGLYERIPESTWRRWLAEAEIDEPFPPEEFSRFDTISERYDLLSPALGLSRNSLAQRLHRGKHLLLELDVMADWRRTRP